MLRFDGWSKLGADEDRTEWGGTIYHGILKQLNNTQRASSSCAHGLTHPPWADPPVRR